ncbi:MAG: M23 family metallopeptidase [Acidimicrobiales bacterium]
MVPPNLLEALVGGLLPPPPAPAAAAAPAAPVAPPVTAPAAPKPVAAPAPSRPVASVARAGPRTGPKSTSGLLAALAALEPLGVGTQDAIAVGMGSFPVGGSARYRDDWLEPRFTPYPHPHMGTDVFAARGTPVRSPADGVLRFTNESTGGKSAYVTTADRTYFYMTHLDGFNQRLRSGQAVKRGEVVGYVGSTGNAAGSSPHLHFQVHPRGGAPVNPKPFLDTWLNEATDSVPVLVAALTPQPAAPVVDAPPAVALPGLGEVVGNGVSSLAAALLLPLTPGPIGGMVSAPPGA